MFVAHCSTTSTCIAMQHYLTTLKPVPEQTTKSFFVMAFLRGPTHEFYSKVVMCKGLLAMYSRNHEKKVSEEVQVFPITNYFWSGLCRERFGLFPPSTQYSSLGLSKYEIIPLVLVPSVHLTRSVHPERSVHPGSS